MPHTGQQMRAVQSFDYAVKCSSFYRYLLGRREVKPAGPRNWTVSMDATLPGNQHRQLQCLYNNILMNSKQRQVNLGRIRWLLSLFANLDQK